MSHMYVCFGFFIYSYIEIYISIPSKRKLFLWPEILYKALKSVQAKTWPDAVAVSGTVDWNISLLTRVSVI